MPNTTPRGRLLLLITAVAVVIASLSAGITAYTVINNAQREHTRSQLADHDVCADSVNASFFAAITDLFEVNRADPAAVADARARFAAAGYTAGHLDGACPIGGGRTPHPIPPPPTTEVPTSSSSASS